MNNYPMTEVAVAEAKLRDAKRVAMHAYTSRAENLHLIRAKQTGRILAINGHTMNLDAARKELQTLEHDSKYGNFHSYVTDQRVDDFLAQMIIEHRIEKTRARIAQLEKTRDSVQDIWDAQVKHLEPNHVATLAVLNYASGNIDESFPIDPERCRCGRIFHFNATLCMNFCTVHKIYYPVLSADDKSTRKAKPSPGNYTNNSNNVRHAGKTHRFVITSENQICAANNILYRSQLQTSQERVVQTTNELRVKLVKKEQAKKVIVQKPKKPPKPPKPPRPAKKPQQPQSKKKPTEPKKKKEPKKKEVKTSKPSIVSPTTTSKPKNQTTIERTLAKQLQLPLVTDKPQAKKADLDLTIHPTNERTSAPSKKKQQCLQTDAKTTTSKRKRPQTTTTTTCPTTTCETTTTQTKSTTITQTKPTKPLSTTQPVQKKQQLQLHKNTANYECYLMQFAPDAPEITSTMLQQIHAVVSTIAIFGEARCLQEINTLIDTSVAFRDVRSHAQRILKLSRAQPVPIIDTELRQRLISRYREIQGVLTSWQQHTGASADGGGGGGDASTKSRRRFSPCNESLTHNFLLGENQWHLASAFAAHSTLKVELDHVQRFRDLIQTVARNSTFVWKHDFDLVVDENNNRTPL